VLVAEVEQVHLLVALVDWAVGVMAILLTLMVILQVVQILEEVVVVAVMMEAILLQVLVAQELLSYAIQTPIQFLLEQD